MVKIVIYRDLHFERIKKRKTEKDSLWLVQHIFTESQRILSNNLLLLFVLSTSLNFLFQLLRRMIECSANLFSLLSELILKC